jgi:hypothetical protein
VKVDTTDQKALSDCDAMKTGWSEKMFKRVLFLIGVFAMLTVTMTSAQDEMPAAPEEASQMDWFVGDWNVKSRMLVSLDPEQWVEDEGTSSVSTIIGGYALMETFSGSLGGSPVEGVSIRTYNSDLGKWEQRWIDNTTPGFFEFTGAWDGEQFVAEDNKNFVPEDQGGRGELNGRRETFYEISDDHFLWKYEGTRDGGETWREVWTLEYTRRG